MPQNSSNQMTMPNVAKDRIITQFPEPYKAEATPYSKVSFSAQVKNACQQRKTGSVGLKVCKAVMVGDVAVGKTSLVNRFCHNVFDRDYKATIGVDFEVEKFSILSIPFNLQMWDTAGQERFKCIAASYYRGANVVIVVFDLGDMESLAHARKWKEDACESAEDPLVFLVGTKKDLVSGQQFPVIEAHGIQLAKEIGAEFWAVSSKEGENVQEFFFRVVSLVFDMLIVKELESLSSAPSKQIGTIKIERKEEDLYERNTPPRIKGLGRQQGCC